MTKDEALAWLNRAEQVAWGGIDMPPDAQMRFIAALRAVLAVEPGDSYADDDPDFDNAWCEGNCAGIDAVQQAALKALGGE